MFSGKKLKELRKKSCLTWKALAEKVCVNWRSVADWEREGTQPRADKLMALAKALGVSIEELFE